ncbi:DNA mismatch repair protein MutS [Acetobacteraceae bacterium]|nr:DNA mismatch repair protein MutS [Acetobacteraceae bacterium]
MSQWFDLKEQEPNALLFFRMGDFYELFFDDAHTAAAALDIALTTRGEQQGSPIPMCGVPVRAADSYLARLIKQGFRIAIVEQEISPIGTKGPMPRKIVRIVTPGTILEEELLDSEEPNLLLSIRSYRNHLGVAWCDISTGSFETKSISQESLPELLSRLSPSEILSESSILPTEFSDLSAPVFPTPDLKTSEKLLSEAVGKKIELKNKEEILASGSLLHYLRKTQAGALPLLHILDHDERSILGMDGPTRQNLEIVKSRRGEKKYSLLWAIDRNVTPAGKRLLKSWISAPSCCLNIIEDRQSAWELLSLNNFALQQLQNTLRQIPDMARILGRIRNQKGNSKSIIETRNALIGCDEITLPLQTILTEQKEKNIPPNPFLSKILGSIYARADQLKDKLVAAFPPNLNNESIIDGFDSKLDQLRYIQRNSKAMILSLEKNLKEKLETSSLKIKHHSQLGFIIEIPSAQAAKIKTKEGLILRQGTANLKRYSCIELEELSVTIKNAEEEAEIEEKRILEMFTNLISETSELDEISQALAEIDVLCSCATLKNEKGWCRPILTETPECHLSGSWHPIVATALKEQGKNSFIPNDCELFPAKRLMLLTGPNMAGKSTFLRQTALAVILAQAGFPVPAKKAKIGIADRIFSRIGASDDLARGQSTFMIEMEETAAILTQATEKSLIVVDEIGRGTATSDGISIAWATLEALHSKIKCRGIFASHFHELANLSESLPALSLYTMATREWNGELIFLHEIKPGVTFESWGIHVAAIAGIPQSIIKRAKEIRKKLEDHPQGKTQLPLFENISQPTIETKNDKLLEYIQKIDPDTLTPRQAHELLYELKTILED